MNVKALTLDEIEAMAAAIGLSRLSPRHLWQLQQVTDAKRSQDLTALMADLHPADEPAAVFGLAKPGSYSKPA